MCVWRLLCCCLVLGACVRSSVASLAGCGEVRRLYQLRQVGAVASVPDKPKAGTSLQVCTSRNLTCCNKKMEERYLLAARRDVHSLLQTSSSDLKLLISRNVATFQEMFESLLRQAENYTKVMFLSNYRNLADESSWAIKELFTDIGLFVLGSEMAVDDFVHRFFDNLFPSVYNHLIDPGLTDTECLRMVYRHQAPFGSAPRQLAQQIGLSVLPGRLFLQALNLGIEVINTTDHLQYTRECKRALLKMLYCPHCQGQTHSKPCTGYCLNVMRGCLANMAEIDSHWREFVQSLEEVSKNMQGTYDLEQVLLNLYPLISGGITHAQRNGLRLLTQIHKVCGHPARRPAQSVGAPQEGGRSSMPLQASRHSAEETLSSWRKDFIGSLRLYRAFYGGLADQLCVGEVASGDGLSCWNGEDVVKSYTLRVVGNGIKAQMANPEVKVKAADPVINQIIDKLKHINQLLQGKSIPKYGTLDQIETGSGDTESRYSGDCDDEDGCIGSGSGELQRKVPKWLPDKVTDRRPQTDTSGTANASSSAGRAVTNMLGLISICLLSQLGW